MCLNAGKNVLCEKPFTINVKQAEYLVKLAKDKKKFLMEATWIRFFPLTIKLQELVQRVFADHGRELIDENTPKSSRFVDMDLGAGGFVDLGMLIVAFTQPALMVPAIRSLFFDMGISTTIPLEAKG
jgi:dihydrodiol dehydrogenase / D-xylose 1-dehydrogenase (NADP)